MNEKTEVEKVELISLEMSGASQIGKFRTFLIFLDLPLHFEFRVMDAPLFNVGSVIHVKLALRNPKDPKRIRKINGAYQVKRVKILYSNEVPSKQGWSQYLELSQIREESI